MSTEVLKTVADHLKDYQLRTGKEIKALDKYAGITLIKVAAEPKPMPEIIPPFIKDEPSIFPTPQKDTLTEDLLDPRVYDPEGMFLPIRGGSIDDEPTVTVIDSKPKGGKRFWQRAGERVGGWWRLKKAEWDGRAALKKATITRSVKTDDREGFTRRHIGGLAALGLVIGAVAVAGMLVLRREPSPRAVVPPTPITDIVPKPVAKPPVEISVDFTDYQYKGPNLVDKGKMINVNIDQKEVNVDMQNTVSLKGRTQGMVAKWHPDFDHLNLDNFNPLDGAQANAFWSQWYSNPANTQKYERQVSEVSRSSLKATEQRLAQFNRKLPTDLVYPDLLFRCFDPNCNPEELIQYEEPANRDQFRKLLSAFG